MANCPQRYKGKKLPTHKIWTPKIIKGLPYSQAIRIERVSSSQVDLNNSLKEIKTTS